MSKNKIVLELDREFVEDLLEDLLEECGIECVSATYGCVSGRLAYILQKELEKE